MCVSVLKVIIQETFVSFCVTGTYFSFFELALDINMNCETLFLSSKGFNI